MTFFKKHFLSFLFFFLLSSILNYSYAENLIALRKKQIRNQGKILRIAEEREVGAGQNYNKLEDYLETGLKNNPGIKAAFYEWKSSFAKIGQAFSLPDPQFTYTEYIESVETRAGPQNNAYSLSQKFPLPDKLWIKKSKAFKASEEAYYNFNNQRLDLIKEISDAYYEYAYLEKAVILTAENIKLLENIESVAQNKYQSGLVQNHDLLKFQIELGKLENDLLSLKDLRKALSLRLSGLLNLPKNIIFPWPEESLEDVTLEAKYEEVNNLYDELINNNLEILALSENIEKNQEALKLAKRDYFPDLTLGVTTVDTSSALMPGTIDSGKDPWMVMFSVNLPIWWGRLDAAVEEKKSSLKAAQNQLENKQNELLSQLAFVHYRLRDALRQSYLYKKALLPKADQALSATQTAYEAGKADFLSFIDAQRILLSFQLAYYRQNSDFYQRLAELKKLLGEVQTDLTWQELARPR